MIVKLSGPEYACLVEQAPILVWRARTDKLCDYFNDRWLEFTGRAKSSSHMSLTRWSGRTFPHSARLAGDMRYPIRPVCASPRG